MLSSIDSPFLKFLAYTLGPNTTLKLLMGTAGVFCPVLGPYLAAVVPIESIADAFVEAVAPPPTVVLTKAAKEAASYVAKGATYLILGGAHRILIRISDETGLTGLLRAPKHLFNEPEQKAAFLGDQTSVDVIEEYDSAYPVCTASPPLKTPTPFTQALLRSSLLSSYTPQQMGTSSLRSRPAPVMLEITKEQEDVIVNNFEGEQREVKNLDELLDLVKDNEEWKSAVDQLTDFPIEFESWASTSVVFHKTQEEANLAASILNEAGSNLYDSWTFINPSPADEQ